MPENWLQVLTVTDGGAVGGFFIHSSEALLKNAELLRASLRQDEPDFPERYYPVGSMVTGDILCLDLGDRCSKEDAPVLLISHETLQMERCWPTIAAFVVDIANNKSS